MTEQMIKAGETLILLLKKHRFAFRAALWLYLSEAEEWRLFLAVPGERVEGKKKFYKKLLSILTKEAGPLSLDALSVVDAKDPLIYSLGAPINVGSVGGRRVRRGTINGRYFEDAYVYRRRGRSSPA
jgi:hypothetical protein